MMAVPARGSAVTQEPAEPAPPGTDPGWAGILITEIAAMRAAVEELARRPDDDAALETARLNLAMGEKLAALFRCRMFDDERLHAQWRLGFDAGVAACRAARCRLKAVPDRG